MPGFAVTAEDFFHQFAALYAERQAQTINLQTDAQTAAMQSEKEKYFRQCRKKNIQSQEK